MARTDIKWNEDTIKNCHEKFSFEDIAYLERGPKNQFKISWKMTDYCPYSCSYCYMSNAVQAAKAKNDNPSQEFVEKIASKIDKYLETHAKPNVRVELHLIGGEVSIFDLIGLLNQISRVNRLNIVTNLYRSKEYWAALKQYLDRRGIELRMSASFHLPMLSEEKRLEFIEKANLLKAQVKAVVNNENLQEYYKYFIKIMELKLPLEITVERKGDNKSVTLSEENQKLIDGIREYQAELMSGKDRKPYYIAHLKDGRILPYTSNISLINNLEEHSLDLTGYFCNAGINNVRINQKGQILRSACRLCSAYMFMGNLLDESTWVPKSEILPFICDCNIRDKTGRKAFKGCVAFCNTEMWLPGYNTITCKYNPPKRPVVVPNYWAMYDTNGTRELKDCDWSREEEEDFMEETSSKN